MQEYQGYVFKIMGGQDKQGFGMKQGVLTPGRVALLMKPGDSCFRGFGRRKGERRRKGVRGCIVSQDLSVLNLVIVKKGALHLSLPAVLLPGMHSATALPACFTATHYTLQDACSTSWTRDAPCTRASHLMIFAWSQVPVRFPG